MDHLNDLKEIVLAEFLQAVTELLHVNHLVLAIPLSGGIISLAIPCTILFSYETTFLEKSQQFGLGILESLSLKPLVKDHRTVNVLGSYNCLRRFIAFSRLKVQIMGNSMLA